MSEALNDKQEKEMMQRYLKTHAKPKLMKAPKPKMNINKMNPEEIIEKIYHDNFKRIFNILKLNNTQLPWRLLSENNNNNNEMENYELIYEWDEKMVQEYLESNDPNKNIKDAIKRINLKEIVDLQNIPLYKEIPTFDYIKSKKKNKNILKNIQTPNLKIETAKKVEYNIHYSNEHVDNLNELRKNLNREVSKHQLEKYFINNEITEENKDEINTKIDLINKRVNILMKTVEYFNKKYSKNK